MAAERVTSRWIGHFSLTLSCLFPDLIQVKGELVKESGIEPLYIVGFPRTHVKFSTFFWIQKWLLEMQNRLEIKGNELDYTTIENSITCPKSKLALWPCLYWISINHKDPVGIE